MIPFIDNLVDRDDIVDFDNYFINKFLSIRLFLTLITVLLMSCFIIIVYIPIIILNILNNILDLSKYIYIKIKSHPRFKNSRIRNIMNNWYSKIEKEELLYLGGKDLKFKDVDLKQFIIKFFNEYNNKYNTYPNHYNINLDTPENFRWTYRNFNVFCETHRRRSLGDVYRISKTYFPSTKIEEVLEILIQLCESKELSGSYCTTIHKFVFHKQNENFYPKGETEYGDIIFKDVIWYIKNK